MQELRIQSVGVLLRNPRGQILLQQRDHKPGLSFPGCWTTFGGRVEDHETPDEAMRRELLEEIELAPTVKLWKMFERPHQLVDGLLVTVEQYVYVGDIDLEVSEIILNEGQALGYFSADDLDSLQIAFGFESLFKEYFEVYG
jgi:8-oxo-dGTP diphosphatase